MLQPAKKPRQKKCKAQSCREWFSPQNTLQKVCSPGCALELAREQQAKAERRRLRERKAKLKTRAQWLREAQAAFNAWVREVDKDKPCISCGTYDAEKWDAGHYRTVGACSSLRFYKNNCHKQCVPCNQHKSGNVVEYRIRLVRRIGAEEVERIEQADPVRRWTIEDAKRIKAQYTQWLKELRAVA